VPPRLRFAPSPTGYLHVGGARTALFNWLYVRRHGGTFVLRIEDTDVERSSADMVTGILESLTWLGLDWDEGPVVGGPHAPYFQTERLDKYRAAVDALVSGGHAYRCFCRPDDLKVRREAAEAAGGGWIYDRTCLRRSSSDIHARLASGEPHAIRFLVPEGETSFEDLVHGRIAVAHATIDDFVILRSDGYPTYQLSVVVDDVDMAITQVVRGDDHISNTPKQILIYRAMGAPVPAFAHVPLILGADKKRLSKRHGATSVMEYQRQGYLAPAVVNFLALLGWSPGDDRELMTTQELIDSFTLEGISGGNAVFNTEKLDWMNGQYIARMPIEDLAAAAKPFFDDAGLGSHPLVAEARAFHRLLELLRPRAKRLTDFVEQARPLLTEVVAYEQEAVDKHLSSPDLAGHIVALGDAVVATTPFDEAQVEAAVRGTASARGIKAGALIHATRVAVTGRTQSPGLFEVLAWLGRDRVRARLGQLQEFLAARVS
jgi:glutamyl-tRNA synthetase